MKAPEYLLYRPSCPATLRVNPFEQNLYWDDDDSIGLITHLLTAAKKFKCTYLLAFSDEGIRWGRCSPNELTVMEEVDKKGVNTTLLPVLIQEIRLFGKSAEYLLWRAGSEWSDRVIEDASENDCDWNESIEVKQYLWGQYRSNWMNDTFTHIHEGRQGLSQVLPIRKEEPVPGRSAPPRLTVRQYLNRFDVNNHLEGPDARIVASRLVDLSF